MDVLLGRPAPAEGAWCWRAPVRVDGLAPGASVPIQPLPVHRELYLELREPRTLDGARGQIRPIRRGTWCAEAAGCVLITWEDGERSRFRLEADGAPASTEDPSAATRLVRLP